MDLNDDEFIYYIHTRTNICARGKGMKITIKDKEKYYASLVAMLCYLTIIVTKDISSLILLVPLAIFQLVMSLKLQEERE